MADEPEATLEPEATEQPAPEVAPAPEPAAAADNKFVNTVVVAAGKIGGSEKRATIVVEQRDDQGQLVENAEYATGADVYFRYTADLPIGDPAARHVDLGLDVQQGARTTGFSSDPRFVHVGPASPPYAAANWAFLQGARSIDIVGLTDAQKSQLAPWIAQLAEDPLLADLKVTLA